MTKTKPTLAWGLKDIKTGQIYKMTFDDLEGAEMNKEDGECCVRVIIKEYKGKGRGNENT